MATVLESPRTEAVTVREIDLEPRFLISGLNWDGYESMLAIVGDRRIHVTYDRGTLELMSPSAVHEGYGRFLARIIDIVAEELEIPCLGFRSTTWRRRPKDRGIEADECFYLANTPAILANGKKVDLNVDPPPDLCIEVEITHSAMDRMSIYAALGVPEVWRFDGTTLRVSRLGADGEYVDVDHSPCLPFLPLAEIVRLIALAEDLDDTTWAKAVRAWVREAILPHYRPPGRHAD